MERDLEREGSPVDKGPRLKGAATEKMAQMEKKWRRDWMDRGTSMERGSGERPPPPSMERTSMKWGKGLPREDPRESSGVRVGRGGGKGAALEKAGDADLGPGRQAGGKAQKTDRAWILPPLPTEP